MKTSTVIDEGSWSKPELRAVLAGWIHDTKVIFPVSEQQVLLTLWKFSYASHQVLDLVISFPTKQYNVRVDEG